MNGFAEGCLEVYENRTDNLSNNLRLTEIDMQIKRVDCKMSTKKHRKQIFRLQHGRLHTKEYKATKK